MDSTRAHPLVKKLYRLMNDKGVSTIELAAAAGVDRSTIQKWQQGKGPNLVNLEACLNVAGYKLVVQLI